MVLMQLLSLDLLLAEGVDPSRVIIGSIDHQEAVTSKAP